MALAESLSEPSSTLSRIRAERRVQPSAATEHLSLGRTY